MDTDRHVFSYDEAYEASLQYFNGDELAARVWLEKYALKDTSGQIYEKTPEAMHRRLARELARVERTYPNPLREEEIFQLLDHFRYVIPAGSPMTGIGNEFQVASLSNCFVIGIDGDGDSYGAVMKMDEEQVQLMKRRGGVGHDLSQLRPKGMPVHNSALTSTGIVPFMERYSNSTREVAQDGRRGALMLSVSIRHPEAEAFIDAKLQEGRITGANVSVRVDDEFMRAAVNGGKYVQQFPVDAMQPQYRQEIDAAMLWGKIIHNAWQSAEPGVLFWDTILRESIPDCYADLGFRTVSTNPCGEIPLCPYDSCRLMALNLYSYVENPFTAQAKFNFDLFSRHVQTAQRLMDDIIDLEREKIRVILDKVAADPQSESVRNTEKELWEKIDAKCVQGRRTGLGITGEGDMLAALGLRYGSEEAIEMAVRVQRTLALSAYRSSVQMAHERGAFPIFDAERERENPFIQRIKEADGKLYDDMLKYGRRNIACLTIAPTGTTSLMTQTTSGIEPVFKVMYRRRRKINPSDADARVDIVNESGEAFEEFVVYHHKFRTWMQAVGLNPDLNFSPEELNDLIARSPYHLSTANDVDWVSKVRMQGAIQQWVDHSISVTVNLPADVDEEMVNKIYLEAWRSGCKGCTIYREGSRTGVLVDVKKEDRKALPLCVQPEVTEVRPQVLECDVVRFQNNKDKWVAFVGLLGGHPYEIFTGLQDDDEGIVLPKSVTKGRIIKQTNPDGTKRYDFQFENKRGYKTTVEGLSEKFNKEYWNYAKLISGVLRYRMPVDRVIKLVSSLQLGDDNINTWKTGVERALKKYVKDGTRAAGVCPHCGQETLVYQEGCLICQNCGTSRCG